MVLGVGVEGGGGGGGERKEPSVSVCVRARGCSRWSLLSQRVALRPSPVAVCEGGREPGQEGGGGVQGHTLQRVGPAMAGPRDGRTQEEECPLEPEEMGPEQVPQQKCLHY